MSVQCDENEPVIVVSSPRSGTTWLGNILNYHPDIQVYKDKTTILYSLYPLQTLNPNQDDYCESRKSFSPSVIKRVQKYYQCKPGKFLVLVSPTNSVFLPTLKAVYPNARYIHLQRDPTHVIASYRSFTKRRRTLWQQYNRMRKYGLKAAAYAVMAHLFHKWRWLRFSNVGYLGGRPKGFQAFVAKENDIEFFCDYYTAVKETILENLSDIESHRIYNLNYEALVVDYENQINHLLAFIGVAPPGYFLEETKKWLNQEGLHKSKQSLTIAELDQVNKFFQKNE